MSSHQELRARARATYDAAADTFDAPENTFWNRFGRRTVDRLEIRSGMCVLDVCAGSGASAIPAAEAVGPTGRVVALDIAANLIARLRAKAEAAGVSQLDARVADLLEADLPEGGFDAVVCVFGIFFLADMSEGVRHLWRAVRPGGQLAITTWGPRLFEPVNTRFWEAIRRERPDLYKGFNPWDAITEPGALGRLLAGAGVTGIRVVAEPGTHALASPSAWWTTVMGSGYRGTVERLTPEARMRVEDDNLRYLVANGVQAIETNVIYAVARKEAI